MKQYGYILSSILLLVLAGCSGAANVPDPQGRQNTVFELGAPSFDMDAVAVFYDGKTGIDVYAVIPVTSLVYLSRGDVFEAGYELVIRVLSSGNRSVNIERAFADTLVTSSYDSTRSPQRLHRHDRIDVPPGTYTVEVSLEDARSGAQAVRSRELEIADASGGETLLADVLLKASRRGGSFHPALSIHLPTGYDSLRASTELYNLPERAEAVMTLVRFDSDKSVALPPYYFTPGPFTMPYVGVDYDRGDTIQVSRRSLMQAGDYVSIDFSLPVLERGNYMVELVVSGTNLERKSSRHFAVMREGFPMITGLDEMVESLRYIARDYEWSTMMQAPTSEEKKRLFDAFWAGLVPNKEAAATLLKTYYSRVEEANVLFSNHKEGWKTDLGMIYVVFGAPSYTETHYLRREWYYFEKGIALSRRLPPFIFRRSTAYGLAGLFENYVLQRSPEYEHDWRRRIEKWREGVSM